jgi:hypothetical protein
LRLWKLRNAVTPYSRALRRAQPTRLERAHARRAVARASARLRTAERAVGLERLDATLVINLAARTDRLSAVEGEFGRIGAGFERFDAYTEETPRLGCTRSHLGCVERMLDQGWAATMICEDDVQFTALREEIDVLVDAFLDDEQAEVLSLAYFVWQSAPHDRLFRRGTAVSTLACYVVKASIAEDLAAIWRLALTELRRGENPHYVMCDRIWMRLQPDHVFLVPMNRAARQASGYSDIEQRVVAYTH